MYKVTEVRKVPSNTYTPACKVAQYTEIVRRGYVRTYFRVVLRNMGMGMVSRGYLYGALSRDFGSWIMCLSHYL